MQSPCLCSCPRLANLRLCVNRQHGRKHSRYKQSRDRQQQQRPLRPSRKVDTRGVEDGQQLQEVVLRHLGGPALQEPRP